VSSDQRLDDVRFWEKEVDDKLSALKQETDALDMFRNRLQAAVEAYEEPLRIAQLCLANRFVDSNPQTEADLRGPMRPWPFELGPQQVPGKAISSAPRMKGNLLATGLRQ